MKKLLSIVALTLAVNAYAACEDMFPYGKPALPKGNYTELCRKGYAVIYDNDKKIPFLTYEHLTPETIGRGQSERGSFTVDTDVQPQYRSGPKDYAHQKRFDRGHMANAQNAGDDAAMADTMKYSNLVPQVYTFNRGSWKVLETKVAKAVRNGADLYVITAAATKESKETIGNGVVVPTDLAKVVIDKKTGGEAIYIMPNETNNKSYRDFKATPEDLKAALGADVTPNKP